MRVNEEQVRAAAEASLARWPAASAVLLYGSRARGDHLPDSDWDLAVVTDDPQGCPSGLPLLDLADLEPPEVDVAFISDSEIRRCRNLLGQLGCALAREARPIAGSWRPPAGIGEPQPDPEVHRSGIECALSSFSDAVESVYWSFGSSSTAHAQRSADDFADSSERCAKHLVRAILVRSGSAAAVHEKPRPPRRRHCRRGSGTGGGDPQPEGSYAGRSPQDPGQRTMAGDGGRRPAFRAAPEAGGPAAGGGVAALAGQGAAAPAGGGVGPSGAETPVLFHPARGRAGGGNWTGPPPHRGRRRWPCARAGRTSSAAPAQSWRHGGSSVRTRRPGIRTADRSNSSVHPEPDLRDSGATGAHVLLSAVGFHRKLLWIAAQNFNDRRHSHAGTARRGRPASLR